MDKARAVTWQNVAYMTYKMVVKARKDFKAGKISAERFAQYQENAAHDYLYARMLVLGVNVDE